MNKLAQLQLALPAGSLETYIQSVNRIPMLSAEQERLLAIRFRETNDLDAARQLVLSHLRFVGRSAPPARGKCRWAGRRAGERAGRPCRG